MIIPNIWENKIHVPNHQPEKCEPCKMNHPIQSHKILIGWQVSPLINPQEIGISTNQQLDMDKHALYEQILCTVV